MSLDIERWTLGFGAGAGARAFGLVGEWESERVWTWTWCGLRALMMFGCLGVWVFGCLGVWVFGCLGVRTNGCWACGWRTRVLHDGPGTGGVTSPSGVFAMVNGTVIVVIAAMFILARLELRVCVRLYVLRSPLDRPLNA